MSKEQMAKKSLKMFFGVGICFWVFVYVSGRLCVCMYVCALNVCKMCV